MKGGGDVHSAKSITVSNGRNFYRFVTPVDKSTSLEAVPALKKSCDAHMVIFTLYTLEPERQAAKTTQERRDSQYQQEGALKGEQMSLHYRIRPQ